MPDGGGVVFSSQQQHDQNQQYIAQQHSVGEVQQQQQQQNYILNSSTNSHLMNQSIGIGSGSNNNSILGNENSLHIDGNVSMLNDVQNQNHGVHGGPGVSSGSTDLRRDFFEDLRNGGGHWSQLLRQVIFSPPHLNLNRDRGQQQQQQQQDNQNLQSPPPPPATGPPDEDSEENVDGHQLEQQQPSEQESSSSITLPVQFFGGSENGQFAYIGHLNSDISQWIAVGYLQVGDIILDVHGQQVAGYTQADVLSLLHHCLQSSITLTVAPRGSLGPDLRSYLNTRFQKGSVDHALQGVVRDNLYLRTVPVTTRPARPGEIHGVDYTFLSAEEFMELERNGSLLESGVYSGNHYGTPKPWASGLRGVHLQQGNANESGNSAEEGGGNKIPGMHPSSEGKRRRNRSNVEALGQACDDEPSTSTVNNSINQPVAYTSRVPASDELGPLPENWEMAYTEKGEVYFIDHNTGTSHWLDPRLSRVQKNSLEDCTENELPFGWEKIEDPHYGTYYIDHVNRRTQFENPVIQAKQSTPNKSYTSEDKEFVHKKNPPNPNPKPNSSPNRSISRAKNSMNLFNEQQQKNDNMIMSSLNTSMLQQQDMSRKSNRFFTRDPTQLIGERIVTTLIKSSKGLGFTIVGGDDDDGLDEFLQIKSVVTDGPAWRDSKLRTGDVLVRVSGRCVLGYTHQEMVSIFQSISPGEEVHLEVCRGYPLPFDPADPNTEIVTTVAVAPLPQTDNSNNNDKRPIDWGRSTTPDSLANSAHSLPELSNDRGGGGGGYGKSTGRPASVDLLLDSPSSSHTRQDKGMQKPNVDNNGILLSVGILKKDLVSGYGFTIADSVAGQKVKKILDSTHCGGLQEGDRLIAIDGIDLRGLSHTQVVQILKDFPLGKEATLTIQRLHTQPTFSIKFNTASSHYSDSRLLNLRPGISPGRSKTPTADMSQGGRTILPERSKTPLIESTGMNGGQNEQHHIMNMNGGQMFDHFHNSNNEADQSQIPIIRDWVEMTIELQRKEGFGFRIVGGTEEGSQVSVGHIVPRGAAALDGRLKTNDQIIAVDNISVVGASHHSVVQLMARSASIGRVSLTIRRPVYGISTKQQGEYIVSSPTHSPSEIQPIHIMLRRQTTEGFGFVIISSASKAGATIGRIVEESPADRCQHLNVGDRILAVNQIDISQLHHSQVVQLIKESGLSLTLSVFPSIEINGGNHSLLRSQQYSISGQPSNMIVNDLDNMSLKDSGYDIGTAFISPESYPVHFNSNGQNYVETLEQVFSVHLTRGVAGFGFSIRGGKEFQNMPLFVLRLAGDGPAAMDGRMEVGDQILQINSINTLGMTHSQAIHLIKTGGNNVNLLLRRGAVPFPFLNQMPNFSSEGLGNSNGQEIESLSSNNDLQSPTYIGLSSPMYRSPGFPNPQL